MTESQLSVCPLVYLLPNTELDVLFYRFFCPDVPTVPISVKTCRKNYYDFSPGICPICSGNQDRDLASPGLSSFQPNDRKISHTDE